MLAKGSAFGQIMSPRLLRFGLIATVRRACSITSFRRLARASCSSPEILQAAGAAAHFVRGVLGTPCPKICRSSSSRNAGTEHECQGIDRESVCCSWRLPPPARSKPRAHPRDCLAASRAIRRVRQALPPLSVALSRYRSARARTRVYGGGSFDTSGRPLPCEADETGFMQCVARSWRRTQPP